jgi:hypothetical protein
MIIELAVNSATGNDDIADLQARRDPNRRGRGAPRRRVSTIDPAAAAEHRLPDQEPCAWHDIEQSPDQLLWLMFAQLSELAIAHDDLVGYFPAGTAVSIDMLTLVEVEQIVDQLLRY